MNKKELVKVVAEECGIKKKDAEAVLDSVIEEITNVLVKGDKVSISGFGTFSTRNRAARICYNPKTNKRTEITPSCAPVFKVGKGLRTAVNSSAEGE